MATAKALTPTELEQVLHYIAQNTNAQRNRVMLLCTVAAGMRVSEVAGLTIGDVRNADGTIRSEVFPKCRACETQSRTYCLHQHTIATRINSVHCRTYLAR